MITDWILANLDCSSEFRQNAQTWHPVQSTCYVTGISMTHVTVVRLRTSESTCVEFWACDLWPPSLTCPPWCTCLISCMSCPSGALSDGGGTVYSSNVLQEKQDLSIQVLASLNEASRWILIGEPLLIQHAQLIVLVWTVHVLHVDSL